MSILTLFSFRSVSFPYFLFLSDLNPLVRPIHLFPDPLLWVWPISLSVVRFILDYSSSFPARDRSNFLQHEDSYTVIQKGVCFFVVRVYGIYTPMGIENEV
jgi:hypothetical protein